ncbi:MAG TPA: TetR/AcrR family transcriptional regulator [Phenylobacterium sp.]
MPRKSDARERAIRAAERLFCEKGYAAAGLTEILTASGAPKGSFYFHFPEGKAQLAEEVLRSYGANVAHWLASLARRHAGDPDGFTGALCDAVAAEMMESGWGLGCAAQNIASEVTGAEAVLADRAGEVFESWLAEMAPALGSRRRAMALLAGLQGARGLARALKSREPFDALKA